MKYIELDLGQPRFNLPGLIAVYQPTSPIFTNVNNFLSLFEERIWSEFIGENNPFNCSSKYITTSISAIQHGK